MAYVFEPKLVWRWTLKKLARTVVAILLNKYDCFMVVEGHTGVGKSTFAYHLANAVNLEYTRLYNFNEESIEYYYNRIGHKLGLSVEEFIEKIIALKRANSYNFNPANALIYSQDAMQKALASWHNISIPDELINITFNRDFQDKKQKDIIKMVNMFRDHENLTICCVPYFINLDTQIRNLTKIRITVKRRGLAIIHTPNKVLYSKDKWDATTNEKIEREWVMRKTTSPNYSRLTTFRGIVKFPPLTKAQEKIYQNIKNKKRSNVLTDEMNVEVEDVDGQPKEKELSPFDRFYQKLLNGGVRNMGEIDGFAFSLDTTGDKLKAQIVRRLKNEGRNPITSRYFYEKSKKREPSEPVSITS